MLEDSEELILEGIVHSKMHLLEVMDIDRNPDRCRLYMQDLISTDTYKVINQGSSQSSYPGVLVGTSLIEIGTDIFPDLRILFFIQTRSKEKNYWQLIHSKNFNTTENFPQKNYFCSVIRKTRNLGKR